MSVKSIFALGAVTMAVLAAPVAEALPTLQLGILGATYSAGTETRVSTGPTFTLYAFLQPGDSSATLDTDYYISAALTPAVGPVPNTTLGSYSFAGATKNVTADMTYGTPPLDAVYGAVYGDLQTHSIFPTFFNESGFKFNANNKASAVDVQTNASLAGVSFSTTGVGDLYYASFDIDVTQLSALYAMHFDLYNTDIRNCTGNQSCDTVVSRNDFAPFSHDAQSGSGSTSGGASGSGSTSGGASTSGQVPEPSSSALALLGLGLVVGSFAMRRKAKGV